MDMDETPDDPMPDVVMSAALGGREGATVMSDSKTGVGDVLMSDARAMTSLSQGESTTITAYGSPFSSTTFETSEASSKSPQINDLMKQDAYNLHNAPSSLVVSADILLYSQTFVARLLNSQKVTVIVPLRVVKQLGHMGQGTEEGANQAQDAEDLIDNAIVKKQRLIIQANGHNFNGQWRPRQAVAPLDTSPAHMSTLSDPLEQNQVIDVAKQVLRARREKLQSGSLLKDTVSLPPRPVIVTESEAVRLQAQVYNIPAIGISQVERLYLGEESI